MAKFRRTSREARRRGIRAIQLDMLKIWFNGAFYGMASVSLFTIFLFARSLSRRGNIKFLQALDTLADIERYKIIVHTLIQLTRSHSLSRGGKSRRKLELSIPS